MAAEVPIVTTRVGGVPDMLTTEHARLVSPDDAEALARGIRDVLDNALEAQTRAKAAAERLRANYGLDPWLDAHEAVYREVSATL